MNTLFPRHVLVFVAAVLLPLVGCASSQDTARDDDRVARQLAAIDEAVDLSDAQRERVREILVAEAADRPSAPPARGGRAGGADRREERAARRAETDRLIEAALTEAQVERYRAWRASQRRPGPPPRGQ